jgi:small ligand-binding sensory domain FIST
LGGHLARLPGSRQNQLSDAPCEHLVEESVAFFGDGLAAGADLESAARQAVAEALAPLSGPPSLVCVFVCGADAYTFPADAFVAESAGRLGGLPMTGGLAGDMAGGGARLYLDGQVHTGGAVGALIGGSLDVATVVSQGCRPVGPPMVVTAVADSAAGAVPVGRSPGIPPQQGNEIAGLAGRQALAKLEEILTGLPATEQALAAQGLHIGIAMDEYADEHQRGDFLIRAVIGADPQAGILTIGDVVEVGQTVRFQVRDAMTAAADLDRLLAIFAEVSGIDPVGGALLFSCNGRGATFFGTADHDVTAVRRALEPDAVGGFFAAGEIGPIGGRSHVHGFAASILMFGAGTGG